MSLKECFTRTLIIASLMTAGVWYAKTGTMQRWAGSTFEADEIPVAALPTVTVNSVGWSADGKTLMSLSRGEPSFQAYIALHDVAQPTGRMPIDVMGESINSAALAPDGRHMLTSNFKGELWWINLDSLDSTRLVKLPNRQVVSATAIAADSRWVAAATDSSAICVCDTANMKLTTLHSERHSRISDLRFSNDGKQLVDCHNDGTISLFDVATQKLLQEFIGHEPVVSGADFLADGERIISAGTDDSVRIWDISSGREVWRGEFGLFGIKSLAVSADGAIAAWGGFNRKIIVWDLLRGKKRFEISTAASIIYSLKFSTDGQLLAAAGTEETIRLYNTQTGIEEKRIDVSLPHGIQRDSSPILE